jgi:integrase/recombinase XerD
MVKTGNLPAASGGAPRHFIQAMLGHADLASTQIYTHVSVEKLKEIHAATHPAKLQRDDEQEALK